MPRIIRRFRCLSCRRTFSTQTFDTTYWLKRPDLQERVLHGLVSCSGMRQMGRALGVAGSTVERQASRLGRHCLLFQEQRGPKTPPAEPLELDGLVTFEYSQFWPFEINVVVGSTSHFFYRFTGSELRRSGSMTAAQEQRRKELEARHAKPDPQATRKAIEALIRMVAPRGEPLIVRSDEHQAYARAFRDLPNDISHFSVSSRRCRSSPTNPLLRVDVLDILLRHSSSNHKRETIAFSKRRQCALERAAVFQVWRNFMKRTRERDRTSRTPAQLLGLATSRLHAQDVLHRRLFPSLVMLPPSLQDIYWRRVVSRQIQPGTRHALKLAA